MALSSLGYIVKQKLKEDYVESKVSNDPGEVQQQPQC